MHDVSSGTQRTGVSTAQKDKAKVSAVRDCLLLLTAK